MLAIIIIVYSLISCSSCPRENKDVDLDTISKYCYEEYTSLGCKEENVCFKKRKRCEKLKSCLEDPLNYYKSEKIEDKSTSSWVDFIENLEEIIDYLKEKSLYVLLAMIFIYSLRFF